jgi:hypothetical protein
MKLRNKKTGEIEKVCLAESGDEIVVIVDDMPLCGNSVLGEYKSLAELNEEWEDAPTEPLIKDEKIRKAVRAWAEASGFSIFKVYNQHFNYVKIHGVKDRYDPNGSNIEFMGTIAGAEKRTYEIDELCGEDESPEPIEPTFVDLDERIKEKEEK